jgi:tetratricopeptide (TPR) repeat protein
LTEVEMPFRAKYFVALVAFVCTLLLPLTEASASPSELLAAGRVDDLIASLQTKIKSVPDDASSYNYLCRAYFALGEWDHAISACEKSIALSTDTSEYHLWLGRAYGEKADRVNPFSAASLAGKVRREFERAVQLDPKSVEARTDLAEFYLDAPGIMGGGQDKARAQADQIAQLSPEKAHYILGRLAEKNKDQATAEKEYRAAIDASKGRALEWFNLALFYRHNSRYDEMEQTLQRATAAPSPDEILVESAEILIRAGRNVPWAEKLVRRYLASEAPSEKAPLFKAHFVLGNALEKQGDAETAAQEYRAALALARDFSPAKEALNRISKSQ